MRIIAGTWGGRTLVSPGKRVRPTQDRVRQVLFDILGSRIQEGPVLDLYAGSGALGLEALSRGAPEAVFVEAHERTGRVLERNREALGALDRSRFLGLPVLRALGLLDREGARFRWILADPPYGDPELLLLLERLGEGACRLLRDGDGLVIEGRRTDPIPEACGRLRSVRRRDVGDTALHFFTAVGRAPTGPALDGQREGTA